MARPMVAPKRREQILTGLYQAIAKKGFAHCSISDVAAECGLARGALHYYFSSKDEMLAELMRSLGEKHIEGAKTFATRFDDPLERIMALFRWFFTPGDGTKRDPSRVWIEFWGHGVRDNGVQNVIREIQSGLRSCFEDAIREGIGSGRFRAVPVEQAVVLLLGMVEGPILQWIYDDQAVDGRQVVAVARDMIASYLLAEPERAAQEAMA